MDMRDLYVKETSLKLEFNGGIVTCSLAIAIKVITEIEEN